MAEQFFTVQEYNENYNRIKKMLTNNKSHQNIPLASLIGGQPGSGKSQLSKFIYSQNKNTIIVDGDYIREFHPNLEKIYEEFGISYPKMTQPFVNRVVEQLIDELSKERYNLIIEGTLRDIHVTKNTARMLNDRDYIVELYVVATSKEQSWKSTIDRGNEMLKNHKYPRYVDQTHHDGIVESLPETVSGLSRDNQFYNIIIMNREQQILYDRINSSNLNPKKIMVKSLNGEQVKSLDELKREREESERLKNTISIKNLSVDKNSKINIHKNTHDLDIDR